ncbi:MAG TPA: AgmX/PglI C-terminal domain-containing protein, partial [Bdellovibrionales bacterium]|nr:AgmX/PglI C-terminal domain-containing protein [Bdellovibrionales bacterium]
VLQNKEGHVVRTFQWKGQSLTLIYRQDTKRVEAVSSTKELEREKIPFTVIEEVDRAALQKKAVAVGNLGYLKLVDEIEEIAINVELEEEDEKPFIASLKWTSGIQAAVVVLCMIIGYFFGSQTEEQKEVVVQVFEQKLPPPVVEPITKKVKPKPQIAHAKRVVKPRNIPLKVTRKSAPTQARKAVALNQMGALGVLGSMSKSNTAGGINLNVAQSTRGPGLGGNAGSGGVQTSLYSRGLVANPLGAGGRATGAGGYGTKGKGGGQAGYGSLSLVGSSNAFFQPIEREAFVEGGLDRDQISEVIQRHLGEVRFCYEQGLQSQPELSGRVAVRFMINAAGQVSTAGVQRSSLRSDSVESCIIQRLKSWKFPEPRGGVNVKVTYPFLLKRTSQG